MTEIIEIEKLQCMCSHFVNKDKVAYILYPMDVLSDWIDSAARRYGTTIVVITGMDWESAFSPWPAKGVPAGSPDFKGRSPEFLNMLQHRILPVVEQKLGIVPEVQRSLVGVSMSGLFALWQWENCDTFYNIASLSGSFWYEGFLDWMKHREILNKDGLGFFLLGDQEAKSKVREFSSVAANTHEIIRMLLHEGIDVEFESVPGNHFSDPIARLDKAFRALYLSSTSPIDVQV